MFFGGSLARWRHKRFCDVIKNHRKVARESIICLRFATKFVLLLTRQNSLFNAPDLYFVLVAPLKSFCARGVKNTLQFDYIYCRRGKACPIRTPILEGPTYVIEILSEDSLIVAITQLTRERCIVLVGWMQSNARWRSQRFAITSDHAANKTLGYPFCVILQTQGADVRHS